MEDKTVIITGANTGIGKATAIGIAKTGARVIIACRNAEKANAARDDIIRESGNQNVVVRTLDLASLTSIRNFADIINKDEPRVDILINNAGIFAKTREVTEDGFEMDFQVNHLAHFLLINLLLDKLKSSAPSRVVIVASTAHSFHGKIDFSNLQLERGWSIQKAYGTSKTMNILTAVQLATDLKGSGVRSYSLCPGAVKTEILRHQSFYHNRCVMGCLLPSFFRCYGFELVSPSEGALTSLYCALEPSIQEESGLYYRYMKVASAKPYATDPEIAQQLWNVSSTLCGLDQEQK